MPQSVSVRKETRELPMLTLRAAFEPSTFDAEKRTVELVWTTGAKGLRRSFWDGDYYEELEVSDSAVRLNRLNNGAPLLAAHNSWSLNSVIGVVERAWIKDGEGRAVVRFSERKELQGLVDDVKSGILRNISVGYTVHRYEVTKEADSKIDTYRAVDWEPMEISIVPIGFDDGAKVRADDTKKGNQVEILFRGLAAPENKNKNEGRSMDEEQQKAVEAAKAQAAKDVAEAATRAERARVGEIRTAVTKAGLGAELADRLVNDGVSIDAARAAIIDAMAEKQKADQGQTRVQHIEAGDDQRDKWVRGASESIIVRAGVAHVLGEAGRKMTGEGFRGMSLVELARDCLELAGVRTRNWDKMKLVGEALTFRSAYNGTSDFSVVLENVMHKVLLGAFAMQPDVWRRFCKIGSVSDFRAHNRYRLGSFGTLDSLNEHGEFRNKQIPDGAKEKISIGTKGNIIGLTRQAIINDDMGAFNGLATSFGRSAGLSVEVDVFAFLALNSGLGGSLVDGNPVFHARAGRNNIVTSAALNADNLDLDRQAMASIKDHSGNEYLDLRPAVLLVPLTLGAKAREINAMEYNEESQKQNKRPNSVRGLFRDIVDTPRITGNRRYLFADPNIAPVIEVAFLDGQQTPFLDNQTGWRVDGVEWKVRFDYGVGGVGCEGAVTNAGG
jgi:hypothetical protein